MPIPAGGEAEDPRIWSWDQGQQLVEVRGSNLLLFQLGTTSRSRWAFEAGISQAPWTGNVGLFWGATRLLDAGISYGFLHLSVDYGMLSRGLVSPLLLAFSIGACFLLGRRGLASDNIQLARRPVAA